MLNVDPGDYSLSADIDAEQARDAANRKLAELALQTGLISQDQYGQFLSMPRAKQTEFAAGIPPNFMNAWKRFGPLLNPSSSWASGIFGEPGRDPKSGAWGTRDVSGNFRPFTPAPTPTPTPTPTPVPAMPASSGRSPIGKIFEHIFGAFGAPSPFGAAATPTPIPTATPTPTPASTPSQPTGTVKSVLMKWPDGYVQPVRMDRIQPLLEQGVTIMF